MKAPVALAGGRLAAAGLRGVPAGVEPLQAPRVADADAALGAFLDGLELPAGTLAARALRAPR